MAVTNYYTVGGRILGERTTGGSRIDYARDHLGSVAATTDSSGAVVNTYRYKPYGGQLAKTGASVDPKYLWVGQWGYRVARNEVYVRSRSYSTLTSRWLTIDQVIDILVELSNMRQSSDPYGYVRSRPVLEVDRHGYFGNDPVEQTNKGCIRNDYPIRLWIFNQLRIEVCLECFACCERGCWAHKILTGNIKLCANDKILNIGIRQLISEMKSLPNKIFGLIDFVVGLATGALVCATGTNKCVPKQDKIGGQAELNFCNLFFSLRAKAELFWFHDLCTGSKGLDYKVGLELGGANCGIVTASLCIGAKLRKVLN